MWMKCVSFMVTRECSVDLGQLTVMCFCPYLLMESFADRHLQIVAVSADILVLVFLLLLVH